jgi:hypothetical protein
MLNKALIKHLKKCDRIYVKKCGNITLLSDCSIMIMCLDAEEILLSLNVKPEDDLHLSKVERGKFINIGKAPDLLSLYEKGKIAEGMTVFTDTELETASAYINRYRYYFSGDKFIAINPVYAEIFNYPRKLWQKEDNTPFSVFNGDSLVGVIMPIRIKLDGILKEFLELKNQPQEG